MLVVREFQMASLVRIALVAGALVSPGFFPASADDSLDLDAYRGNVIVVDFWASWCVPCRRSFPWLNEMHAKYADDGLVIVGINLDASKKDAAAFLEEYPAAFRIYYDSDAAYAKEFDVQAMPSSFVLGRDGKVTAHHLGFKVRRQSDYEAILVAALGAGQ